MSVDLGTAYAKIELDYTGFSNGMKNVKDEVKSATSQFETASKGITAIGNSMADVGGTLTKSVSVPLLGVAAAGMKVATDFEKSMSGVKAITGATGDQFTALRNEAIKLGADTAFSSGEVADAMTEMAKAGWSTQQIMDGMNGVLAATAASGEDLSTVSTIVADSITGFGLAAKDSTRVADLLAQAANMGTIGIGDLGESFKYIAPVAKSMNFSIEDVTQAITAMSKAGIKGSQAGTSLRTMLLNMVNPGKSAAAAMDQLHFSATNADGTFKSLDQIVSELRSSTEGLTDKQKAQYAAMLAGKEASSGLLAILKMTPEEYDAIGKSMDNAKGVAEETAKVMQDNLRSQIEQLGGSLESLAIKLSDIVLPKLTEYAKKATEFVNSIVNLDEGSQKRLLEIGAALIALGPALIVVGKTISALGTMVGVFGKLQEGMGIIQAFITVTKGADAGKLAASFISMVSPIMLVVAGIAALTAGLVYLYKTNESFRNQVNTIGQEVLALFGRIQSAFQPVISMAMESMQTLQSGFSSAFSSLSAAFSNLASSLQPVFEFMKEIAEKFAESFGSIIIVAISVITGAFNGLLQAIDPLIAAFGSIINIFADLNNVIGGLTGNLTQVKESLQAMGADFNSLFTNLLSALNAFVGGFSSAFGETLINLFAAFGVNIMQVLSDTGASILSFAESIWNSIATFFTVTIPEAFNNFVTVTIPEFIAGIQLWFEQLPYNAGFLIGELLVYLADFGLQLVNWVATTFADWINSIVTWLTQLPANAAVTATNFLQKFRDLGVALISWAVVAIPAFIKVVVDFIATLPGKIYDWIKTIPDKVLAIGEAMQEAGRSIMNSLWDGLKSVWEGISGWFHDRMRDISEFVSGIQGGMSSASNGSHADGLTYVPFNGYVAQLHEGEQVLTRNEADAYRNGTTSGGGYIFNYYSPTAIDPYQADKLLRQTVKEVSEGLI